MKRANSPAPFDPRPELIRASHRGGVTLVLGAGISVSRGLPKWDRDVVEAFIAPDPQDVRRYTEFEVSPTNERLDLRLDPPAKDFAWESHFSSATRVNPKSKVWACEMRIPLTALSAAKPAAGTRWRLNFYRCDRANQAFLAWSPTLTDTFHTPERFGVLEFGE